HAAPTLPVVEKALDDLKLVLKPLQKNGVGHIWVDLPALLQERLEQIKTFLGMFISKSKKADTLGKGSSPQWMAASLATANVHQKGTYYACQLCAWAKAFITDRDDLPFDQYGRLKISKLDNEELTNELHLHLQLVGRYVKAGDLITYLSDKEAQSCFGLKSMISLAMAKKWMHTLGYCWR
ncbi:hypothetical protein EV702DRAFT_926113, partial [Suillus placidus]